MSINQLRSREKRAVSRSKEGVNEQPSIWLYFDLLPLFASVYVVYMFERICLVPSAIF